MPTVNSVISSLILCLAIAGNCSLAGETPGRNETVPAAAATTTHRSRTDDTNGTTTEKPDCRENSTSPTSAVNNSNSTTMMSSKLSEPLLKTSAASTKVMEFRPSLHLGEINAGEYRITSRNKLPELESRESSKRSYKSHHDHHQYSRARNGFEAAGAFLRLEQPVDTDGVRVPTSTFRNGGKRGETDENKIPVKFFETDGRYEDPMAGGVASDNAEQQQTYDTSPRNKYQVENQSESQSESDSEEENGGGSNDNRYQNENSDPSINPEGVVTYVYSKPPSGHTNVKAVTLVRPVYSSPMAQQLPVYYQQYDPTSEISQQTYQAHHNYQTLQNYQTIPPNYQTHPSYINNPQSYPGHQMTQHQTIYVKPSKFLEESSTTTPPVKFPQHVASNTDNKETTQRPEVPHQGHRGANYRQNGNNHQETSPQNSESYPYILPHESSVEQLTKPETLYYVTSHREAAVKMHKFPYKFYEPQSISHHEGEYHPYPLQEIPYSFPSKNNRMSPWKKIIHLIGAFLPLGLLLATLKPRVVKIENTTQPNIVLSKLRVVDLPAEHKRTRLVDDSNRQEKFPENTCEDRFICELIVSGSEPSSNLLQNILWNLTNKSTDEEAQKHGLDEIFAAAKKKDCSKIEC